MWPSSVGCFNVETWHYRVLMKTRSHLTWNPATAAFEKFKSRHRWWTELRNAYEFSSSLQTHSVSVKQLWLLSYLKMQNTYFKWAFFWFNVWIGYAVKSVAPQTEFYSSIWLPPQNSLLFWPIRTGSAAVHVCFFINWSDRNVADGVITSLTVLPREDA